jgi:MerR family transcriptional regulator/heat shock protein HspR
MQRYELVVGSIKPDEVTLDDLAALAEMHPALVERFVEYGLIQPSATRGTLFLFDSSKIPRLRSIMRLRSDLGINLQGVAVVLDLVERLRDLERENASMRAKL